MLHKIIFMLFTISYCITIQAQTIEYNKEFQINTHTSNGQSLPNVCGLSDGRFIVCWQGNNQDGDGSGIFGQMFNNFANKFNEEFQVNTYETNYQRSPTVSSLADGGFVISWESAPMFGDSEGIYSQLFDSIGIKRGAESKVNENNTYIDRQSYVCGLSNGGYVISWEAYLSDGSGFGVLGQMFNKDGEKIGISNFQVNTYTEDNQVGNADCGLADGGFVICWYSEDQDQSPYSTFGQIYNSDGTKRGNEFKINEYSQGCQWYADIYGRPDGGFVVCWSSRENRSNDSDIYAKMYDNEGQTFKNEFQVNTQTIGDQWGPSICGLADGGFVICWSRDGQDGSENDIFAQIYDDFGNKLGKEFQVNTYVIDQQSWPSVSGLADGGFVICWNSYGQDGYGYGVYGKYYLKSPILHILQSFSLEAPNFDATLNSSDVDFIWQKANSIHLNFPWEIEYIMYIDNSEDFNYPQIFTDIFDTTYSVKGLIPGQTYFWKVLAKNINGDSLWSSDTFGFLVSPDATQMIHDPVINVQEFELFSNYPNPFNPETTIRYNLPADQSSYRVIIKIYDVLGQLVVTLRDEQQRPGLYHVIWDGRNSMGQTVPSGVYFCVLEAGSFKATQKMLLVK